MHAMDKKLKNKILRFKQQGRHREGLRLLQRDAKRHPADPRVKFDVAFFSYHLGRHKKAIKIYEDLLKKERSCISTLQFLSRVYALEKRKKEEAIVFAKTAYYVLPNFVMANNLAGVYSMLGKNKLAEHWYKKTMKLAKSKNDQLVIKTNITLLYKKMGRGVLGRRYAREILSVKSFVRKKEFKTLVQRLRKEFDI